jgi:hypothetical protein
MRLDEETWAEIRAAYEASGESVRSIAARYGTSESTVYTRIVREGWKLRSSRQRVIAAPPRVEPRVLSSEASARARLDGVSGAEAAQAEPAAVDPLREPDTPLQRAYRMLRLIDMQFDHMETRMKTEGPGSAQDQERHARAFSTLVGQLDQVTDMMAGIVKAPEDARGSDDDERRETERLRHEIAERLERLNEKWLAQTKSD